MDAISKRTGRKLTGKLAEIFVRKGLASPSDGSPVPGKKTKASKVVKEKVKK